MKKRYHRQKIEIVIDKESELYAKLTERAERDGVTVREMVDMLLRLGYHGFLEKRMEAGNENA